MGHVYGEFLPNQNYYSRVQQAVWDFWTSPKLDYTKWDTLSLSVQLDNGCFIYAAGGFALVDSPELPEEPKQIDIAGVDKFIIKDFLLQDDARPFVVEPWETIGIDQKFAFEDELKKELATPKRLLPYRDASGESPMIHVLNGFQLLALCKDGRNDDVLFRAKREATFAYAIVHLTWTGKPESSGYPKVECFESFDAFKCYRMYPDKADWEY